MLNVGWLGGRGAPLNLLSPAKSPPPWSRTVSARSCAAAAGGIPRRATARLAKEGAAKRPREPATNRHLGARA